MKAVHKLTHDQCLWKLTHSVNFRAVLHVNSNKPPCIFWPICIFITQCNYPITDLSCSFQSLSCIICLS